MSNMPLRPIPLRTGKINLDDAKDLGTWLASAQGLGDLYGIWKDLGITEEDLADSKLTFGDTRPEGAA